MFFIFPLPGFRMFICVIVRFSFLFHSFLFPSFLFFSSLFFYLYLAFVYWHICHVHVPRHLRQRHTDLALGPIEIASLILNLKIKNQKRSYPRAVSGADKNFTVEIDSGQDLLDYLVAIPCDVCLGVLGVLHNYSSYLGISVPIWHILYLVLPYHHMSVGWILRMTRKLKLCPLPYHIWPMLHVWLRLYQCIYRNSTCTGRHKRSVLGGKHWVEPVSIFPSTTYASF